MSIELRRRIFDQLDSLVIIDPHTHINALDPASHTLADILGYHYYTELAHSAGLAKDAIEDPSLSPKDKVSLLINNLGPINNTVQWSWFVEMAQKLFGFQGDTIDSSNWEQLYDDAESQMSDSGWANKVLETSKLSAVFLTNEFDDPLEGFDTKTYIPCLRTDDLVFKLSQFEVRERLERFSGIRPTTPDALRQAIGSLFDHFVSRGARACAISLPPDFAPTKVSDGRALSALEAIEQSGVDCHDSHKKAIANFVFWTLCEYCADIGLPFDLMIGVNRSVYPGGVHQGRDLYDSRTSLIQYKEVFNAFPQVKFPVSVLASVTNQELTSYAWIFPNVITSGHWWYSNTPTFIEHDLAARLEAVPRTKQIGYYSDMYKLEFALPKFAMYKRCLAKVLAEKFVIDRGWSEEQAVALGTQVLQGNTETIFPEVPIEKIQLRREKAPPAESLSEPHPHDTFESTAGPKLSDPVISSGGVGLPFGGEVETSSLGAIAAAPLLPSSFDERMEPTIHLDHLSAEGSAIHSAGPAEVHLPEFHPHVPPQTEEDRIALDNELASDPEWHPEQPPVETEVPVIDTHEEPLVASFDEQPAPAVGEITADDEPAMLEELSLEPTDEIQAEEPFELSLSDDEPQLAPSEAASNDFAARATVPFDPNLLSQASGDEEAPAAEAEILDLEASPAPPEAKPADDGFDDFLQTLDLEPEPTADTKPPETDEPPKADPNDPFSFLKK
jgi:glucuronate isomerase